MNLKYYALSAVFFLFTTFAFGQELNIGTYKFKDGSVYTGELQGKKPNGKGTTVFSNGEKFEGEYMKGKRQGYGVFTFPDGTI